MLILTRKANEAVVIDETIVVTVLEVRGQTVIVGIDAPRDKNIARGELVEEK